MIYWIGHLRENDAPLVARISDEFEVVIKRTISINDLQSDCRDPLAIVLSLSGSSEADGEVIERVLTLWSTTPVVLRLTSSAEIAHPLLRQASVVGQMRPDISLEAAAEIVVSAVREAVTAPPAGARQRMRPSWREGLVGESPAIESIAQKIELVANRRSTVLVTGETGTGKEVVARAIHAASSRYSHEFVTVNCGALPESLLEAELFGHNKGAFTGAVGQRIGRFEQAHRGSIFLDEIGDMPLNSQTALLRVLQDKEFQRVGGTHNIRVDVRVIAATNVDIQSAVEKKTFRPDLLYRLQVFPIYIPPLRERLMDVEALADHFLRKISAEEGLPIKRLSGNAINRLSNYHWPGNVRQLAHSIETALVMSGDRATLVADDFNLADERRLGPTPLEDPIVDFPDSGINFEDLVNEVQRGILQTALKRTGGNKSRAASLLNIKRSTLVSKVKALAG